MVFKNQCKLPARNPGSSRQAPLPEDRVTDFISGKKKKTLSLVDVCYCVMDFLQPFQMQFWETEFLEMADFAIFKNNVIYCKFTFTKFYW